MTVCSLYSRPKTSFDKGRNHRSTYFLGLLLSFGDLKKQVEMRVLVIFGGVKSKILFIDS